MVKVTIEFEVKDEYEAEKLRRNAQMLNSPDWIASWWSIDDIKDCDDGWEDEDEPSDPEALTDEEAREVLMLADKYHDCDEGVNWDVLRGWIYHVKAQRKQVA